MGRLAEMLEAQRTFQSTIAPERGGGDPYELRVAGNVGYAKDMVLATLDELHELLGEMGWKPWATSRHVNVAAAQGEWIDAWHFMMNLALYLAMDEQVITQLYYEKLGKNQARQRSNYDGVSTKCPHCKTALDDDKALVKHERVGAAVWCPRDGHTHEMPT